MIEKIHGKCFKVIYNLYEHVKSKVVTLQGESNVFIQYIFK